jgi:hypothetical protein
MQALNPVGVYAWTCCNNEDPAREGEAGCSDDSSVGVRSTLPLVKNYYNNQLSLNHPLQHGSMLFLETSVKKQLHVGSQAFKHTDTGTGTGIKGNESSTVLNLGQGSSIDYFSVHKPAARVRAMEPYANPATRAPASELQFGVRPMTPAAVAASQAAAAISRELSASALQQQQQQHQHNQAPKQRPSTASGSLQRASIGSMYPHMNPQIRQMKVEDSILAPDYSLPPEKQIRCLLTRPASPATQLMHQQTKHYSLYSKPYSVVNDRALREEVQGYSSVTAAAAAVAAGEGVFVGGIAEGCSFATGAGESGVLNGAGGWGNGADLHHQSQSHSQTLLQHERSLKRPSTATGVGTRARSAGSSGHGLHTTSVSRLAHLDQRAQQQQSQAFSHSLVGASSAYLPMTGASVGPGGAGAAAGENTGSAVLNAAPGAAGGGGGGSTEVSVASHGSHGGRTGANHHLQQHHQQQQHYASSSIEQAARLGAELSLGGSSDDEEGEGEKVFEDSSDYRMLQTAAAATAHSDHVAYMNASSDALFFTRSIADAGPHAHSSTYGDGHGHGYGYNGNGYGQKLPAYATISGTGTGTGTGVGAGTSSPSRFKQLVAAHRLPQHQVKEGSKSLPAGHKNLIGKQRAVPQRTKLAGNRPLTSNSGYNLYST